MKGKKVQSPEPEINFIRFMTRILFISIIGILLSIPMVNVVFLDYIWGSKEDKDTLKKIFFGKQ